MNPDDPKLTAYALDELDPADRAEVEQLLRENPEALAEVEDTERLAARLRRELHAEPAAPLTTEQREEVFAVAVAGDCDPGSAADTTQFGTNGASPAGVAGPGYSRRWWSRPLALAASVAVLGGATYIALQFSQQQPARRSLVFESKETAAAPSEPSAQAWTGLAGAIYPDAPASASAPANNERPVKLPALAQADASALPAAPEPGEVKLTLNVPQTAAGPVLSPKVSIASAGKLADGEQAKQHLVDADGFYQTGRYDLALRPTEQILSADPYNIDARNMQEKVNKAIDNYGTAAYNETRSRFDRNVDLAWNMPVPKADAAPDAPEAPKKERPSTVELPEQKVEQIIAGRPTAGAEDRLGETTTKDTEGKSPNFAAAARARPVPAPAAGQPVRGRAADAPAPARRVAAQKPTASAMISGGSAGTSPVTASNGSSSLAISQNAVDALLFGTAGTSAGVPGETPGDGAKVAPQVQAISGVLTDPEFKVVIRALDQKKPAADASGAGIAAEPAPGDVARRDYVVLNQPSVQLLEDPAATAATADIASATVGEKLGVRVKELGELREELRGTTATMSKRLRKEDTSDDALGKELERKVAKLETLEREVRDLEAAQKSLGNVLAQREPSNTESYDTITDNAFLAVRDNPLSTFSIDVDTASYANVRRFLNEQRLPPKGAVRIEELVNYFDYDYPQPDGEAPFSASMEVAACPWTPENRLVRIGLKGREIHPDKRPASNLVFLVDVSGSMQPENKLPLVKKCLRQMVDKLGGEDTVAIAVYAGASGCVLEPTNKKSEMRAALDRLESGGSTNGAAGIQLAYQLAERSFIKGGVNRVILATDGDFNVGVTNQSELIDLIEKKAKSGVFLTVLGFGMGNLKDSTLEKLADKGNGNYAYIDTLLEGRKVLVEQMSGTLVTIAKDVKIQVEFNPAQVGAYRLIGYENRMLKKEDFNDDTKDAGEIGAGHTVTALYEIVPAGAKAAGVPAVDPLKYQPAPAQAPARADETKRYLFPSVDPSVASKELLTLKLRHKAPDGDTSKLLEFPLTDEGKSYERSSRDFRFAAAVASFGMLLRDSPHKGKANWSSTLELAMEGKGEDRSGYRAEFVGLIERAKAASR